MYRTRREGRKVALNHVPRRIKNELALRAGANPVELGDDVSQFVEDDRTVEQLKLWGTCQPFQHSTLDGKERGRVVTIKAEQRAGDRSQVDPVLPERDHGGGAKQMPGLIKIAVGNVDACLDPTEPIVGTIVSL